MFVIDCSEDKYDVANFMFQLQDSHVLVHDDISLSMTDDPEREQDHRGGG